MSAAKLHFHFKISHFVFYLGLASGAAFFLLTLALYSSNRSPGPRGPHVHRLPPHLEQRPPKPCAVPPGDHNWVFQPWRDADNYALSDQRCEAAFPKLFSEIDRSVASRTTNITVQDLDGQKFLHGMVRAMVYNGELLIIQALNLEGFFSRGYATLHSLHRALASFPDRHTLPNIEFTLIVEDFSRENVPRWAYSKRSFRPDGTPSPVDSNIWLMPDFGYWAWPETGVSSYSRFRHRVTAMETGLLEDGSSIGPIDFNSKQPQLVWRGALGPNALRRKLYQLAKGKKWADVQYINWDDAKDRNKKLLPMEEYCRWAFLAHVEGRSYSGRMKYLLHCRSVVVTHPLRWVEAHHAALVSEGPDQNFVQVRNDWVDLEDQVMHLIEHPELSRRIADNSVATFRDRYLTPAAEACYWRRLIRGWASVSFEPAFFADEEKTKWRGVPFETFVLTNMTYP